MREVILDRPSRYVDDVAFGDLSDTEMRALRRVVDVESAGPKRIRLGRKQSGTKVGRARVADLVVTVPPRMAPDLFVTFFLFANGLDARQATRPSAAVAYVSKGPDAFLALLARLMIQAAERTASIRVARRYVRAEDRIKTLRGTPLWARDFGRHFGRGISAATPPRA